MHQITPEKDNFGEIIEKKGNKKVLLRERKRHTDRDVSSTTRGRVPSSLPPLPGLTGRGYPRWGYPLSGYTPQPGLMGGTQGGVPPLGYPPTSQV